ncbi:tail fiber protein [Dysgonomonas sp.]
MNKVNITAQDDFPMDSDGMDFIQKMIHQVYKLARLGGTDYIMEGCDEVNGVISDGQIVINGELLEFKGGQKQDYIVIVETKETVYDEEETGEIKEYPEAYISRYATFSDDGKLKWENVKQILTNQQLEQKISSLRGEPLATKLDFTGRVDRIPDNYMLADGRLLRTAEYPELAWFYGAENQESFSLPDLRHMFIVGYDPTKQDYSEVGKTGGEEKHALTADENGEHQHIVPWGENLNTAWRPDWGYPDDKFNNSRGYKAETDNDNTWPYTSPSGKGDPHENRPQFYVLAYIIKVKY